MIFLSQVRRLMRMDDVTTREQRKLEDGPVAACLKIYDDHIARMSAAILAGRFICLDESLINFYGSSMLKKFIASKPGKPRSQGWAKVLLTSGQISPRFCLSSGQIVKSLGPT
jgi:hypothetical protein